MAGTDDEIKQEPNDDGFGRRYDSSHRTRMKKHMLGTEADLHECIFIVIAGQLLALNAGYLNGVCLSGLINGRSQGVTAFTGAYSNSALALAQGNIDAFGLQICMILCFCFGNFIVGVITPSVKPYRIEPAYGPTFMLGGIFLIAASVLAAVQGDKDTVGSQFTDNAVFYLVALASGIQNGLSSTYSANLIRTTHLTGTTTDIGLYAGQLVRGNTKNTWKLLVLIALAVSYWIGALVSFYATRSFTSMSLLFNAGLFIFIGLLLIVFLVHEHSVSFIQALLGTWHWKRVLQHLQETYPLEPSVLHCGESRQRYVEHLFDSVDIDKTGYIGSDELIAALVDAGFRMKPANIQLLINHADKEGDGQISREEWMLLMGELVGK